MALYVRYRMKSRGELFDTSSPSGGIAVGITNDRSVDAFIAKSPPLNSITHLR